MPNESSKLVHNFSPDELIALLDINQDKGVDMVDLAAWAILISANPQIFEKHREPALKLLVNRGLWKEETPKDEVPLKEDTNNELTVGKEVFYTGAENKDAKLFPRPSKTATSPVYKISKVYTKHPTDISKKGRWIELAGITGPDKKPLILADTQITLVKG